MNPKVNPHTPGLQPDATALNEIREQIRRGEYRVHERAVADAILRHLRELAALRAEADVEAVNRDQG